MRLAPSAEAKRCPAYALGIDPRPALFEIGDLNRALDRVKYGRGQ